MTVTQEDLRDYMHFIKWTPEKLRAARKMMGLYQWQIADLIGLTTCAITQLENGKVSSPWAIQMYGIILERCWAGMNGYIPAFRKIGTNKFMEEKDGL